MEPMAGHVLLVDVDADRCWHMVQAVPGEEGMRARAADILFGDFDRARAEATVCALRRSLPANEIHVVRSGCEALAYLRQRGLQTEPERLPRPVLALLDEDLSGMAGHSILRSMLKLPLLGGRLIILLVGAGRIAAHRQWSPEPDGYLEKPLTYFKLRDCIRSVGGFASSARTPLPELPA
jgi:CheY-like chemotaxis protein